MTVGFPIEGFIQLALLLQGFANLLSCIIYKKKLVMYLPVYASIK